MSESHAAHAPEPCLNCGKIVDAEYCGHCGQAFHEGRTPTLGHFLHDLIHEFLHFDGKIINCLKALLFQPGQLTVDYWSGKIASAIRPLRIFLIVVAINLLLVHTGVGPMNFQVRLSKNAKEEIDVAVGQDPAKIPLKPGNKLVEGEEKEKLFHDFGRAYSAIRYSSVVGFALASWLLYYRRQKFAVNHLIFSLHFYSFWYILAMVGSLGSEANKLVPLWVLVYLMLSLRRIYMQSWPMTIMKTAALSAWMGIIELFLGMAAARMAIAGFIPPTLGH